MKDENKLVITIGRQFGSGGCEVGTKLAHELGLDFYDKNIKVQSKFMSQTFMTKTFSA